MPCLYLLAVKLALFLQAGLAGALQTRDSQRLSASPQPPLPGPVPPSVVSVPTLFATPAVLPCSTWHRCGWGCLGGGGGRASQLQNWVLLGQSVDSNAIGSGAVSSDADLKADLR